MTTNSWTLQTDVPSRVRNSWGGGNVPARSTFQKWCWHGLTECVDLFFCSKLGEPKYRSFWLRESKAFFRRMLTWLTGMLTRSIPERWPWQTSRITSHKQWALQDRNGYYFGFFEVLPAYARECWHGWLDSDTGWIVSCKNANPAPDSTMSTSRSTKSMFPPISSKHFRIEMWYHFESICLEHETQGPEQFREIIVLAQKTSTQDPPKTDEICQIR